MSLKYKLILLILLALVLFGGSQYFIQRYIVLPPFQSLEQDEAIRNVERVQKAVEREAAHLLMLCDDWAAWDATYTFMVDGNADYVAENLTRGSFEGTQLNLIALYDQSGRKIWAEAYELEGMTRVYLEEFEKARLPLDHPLLDHATIESEISGLYQTSYGPMLIASHPILDNESEGPARGSLIMGQLLDGAFFEQISAQVQLDIEAWPLRDFPLPSTELRTYQKMQRLGLEHEVEVISEDHLHTHGVLGGLDGSDILFYSISTPRLIYAQGRVAAGYALASVLGVGILLIALMGILLTRLFINPTIELTKNIASAMRSDGRVSLVIPRRDELGTLAREFNEMVQRLHDTNQELRHEARHDNLTGLPNRTEIHIRIQRCIDRAARRSDYKYALLFLDLDGFKPINDNFGHEFGDALLISLGERLGETLRTTDEVASAGVDDDEESESNSVGRIGGDEFVILLDDLNAFSDAERVARRLQWALKKPFRLKDHKVTCGASIGIAFNSVNYQSPDAILRDADSAMYRAKSANEADAIAIFDDAAQPQLLRNVDYKIELQHALTKGQFQLYYQPVISLETCQPVSYEALLRWHHPRLGSISPTDFIPLAEATGLIVDLGLWVIETACAQIKEWEELLGDQPTPPITVNLSPKQVESEDHVNAIAALIRRANISPEQLRFELTDSIVAEESAQLCMGLNALCELGIQLQIDDFGADFSPVSLLHRYPFTVLKIDRKFLFNLGNSREYAVLVSAVVALAHNFKIQVVAEGIETEDQLAQILALDCDYVQGFLFAPALPAAEAIALLGHIFQATQSLNEAA